MTRRLGSPGLLLTLCAQTLCAGCQTTMTASLNEPLRPSSAPQPFIAASPYSPIVPRSTPESGPPPDPEIRQAAASPDGRKFPFTEPPEPTPLPKLGPIPEIPKANPQPPEIAKKHAIVLAVECLLDNRPDEIRRHLREYDASTQEFLLRVLAPLSLVDRKNLRPETKAAIIEQLTALSKSLEQTSSFAISRMDFCDSIRGFKMANPLPGSHEFQAAQPDRPGELVQLYVELKNFASEPAGGAFETRLSSQIEIRDAQGKVRWQHRFHPDDLKLVSPKTRLTEYYHNYTFALPVLPAGIYELHVETTDETQAGRPTAEASLPLRVK